MTTEVAGKPLRADAARNRQALIDAAQRLFTTRGLSVTLDDIAAAAGLNVATAYRHFANKHELVDAYLEQKISQTIAIAEAAAAADDPLQGLTDFLTRILELMTANRGLHDVFTGSRTEWLERLESHVEPLIAGLLQRAQRDGAVRSDLALGDIGIILSMLAAVGDVVTTDTDAFVRRYLALMLGGMRAEHPALPGRAPGPGDVHAPGSSAPRGGRRATSPDAVES